MTLQPPLRELCQHSGNMSVPPDTGAASKMERKKKKLSICTQGHWFGVRGQRGMMKYKHKQVNTVWFHILITFSRLDNRLDDLLELQAG